MYPRIVSPREAEPGSKYTAEETHHEDPVDECEESEVSAEEGDKKELQGPDGLVARISEQPARVVECPNDEILQSEENQPFRVIFAAQTHECNRFFFLFEELIGFHSFDIPATIFFDLVQSHLGMSSPICSTVCGSNVLMSFFFSGTSYLKRSYRSSRER